MHVDGFRFDLAAVLSRGEDGEPLADPPILWEIETDPVLAGTKLIAEAWDAGGLYQVGSFVGRPLGGVERAVPRRRALVHAGEPGRVRDLTQRFLGSPDIYGHKHRDAQASINFVTCHDGFTLNDLVSYDQKHNEANGEENRDGNDFNMSWNCGVEGPTDDPAIEALRRRQIKNFLVVNLLVARRPDAADGRRGPAHAGRQQQRLLPRRRDQLVRLVRRRSATPDILRFTKGLIRMRRRLATLLDVPDETNLLDLLANASLEWSGVGVGQPDFAESSRSVALTLRAGPGALHIIFNAYWEPLDFELPALDGTLDGWRRIVDTTLDAPDDLALTFTEATPVTTTGLPRRGALHRDHGRPTSAGRQGEGSGSMTVGAERARMADAGHPEEGWREASPWYQWGPYLSERAWGSVREDYSADGDAWNSFPHDHARSRAYRWNEDGMAGISDVFGRLCLGLSLWNGVDPILKERMFGLTNQEGNHGEDVQGLLVVPRRAPERCLAALALPLPAGRRSRTRS